MKLSRVHINGCFGFRDSASITLSPRPGVVYVLGRNSSGKSMFLSAIAAMDPSRKFSEDPRFSNFDNDGRHSFVEIDVVPEPEALSGVSFLEELRSRLEGEAERAQGPDLKQRLIEGVMEAGVKYISQLGSGLTTSSFVTFRRYEDDSYRFSTEHCELKRAERAEQEFAGAVREVARSTEVRKPGREFRLNWSPRDASEIWAKRIIDISPSDEHYCWEELLPDVLTKEMLDGSQNPLLVQFTSLLGRGDLRSYFETVDPLRRREVLSRLQSQADKLSAAINEALKRLRVPDLVEFVLGERGGLQLVLSVGGKSQYYRHASESTRQMIAYFVGGSQSDPGGALLLFDEPSRGLHASAEVQLRTFFESLASAGTQVILATHSPRLIDLKYSDQTILMSVDEHNRIHPKRGAHSRASPSEALAMQALLEAIGHETFEGFTWDRKVVFLEGLTDYLYLKTAAKLLSARIDGVLVPARSVSHIGTLIPFAIARGIGFKVLVDEGGDFEPIRRDFAIPNSSCFLVPVPSPFAKFRQSGIEDLFSRVFFLGALKHTGREISKEEEEHLPNSQLAGKGNAKALVAREICLCLESGKLTLDAESRASFSRALDFCANECWYAP